MVSEVVFEEIPQKPYVLSTTQTNKCNPDVPTIYAFLIGNMGNRFE